MMTVEKARVVVAIFVFILIGIIVMALLVDMSGNISDDATAVTTEYQLIDAFTCPTDDTNGSDINGNDTSGTPYVTFYSYKETDWGSVDDVNDSEGNSASGAFWLLGNETDAESTITFLDHEGNTFCSSWGIETIAWNFKIDNVTHTGVDYTIMDCSDSIILWLTVTDTNAIVYTTGPTELANTTIENDTWYRFEVDIDYSTGPFTFNSTIYGKDLPGLFTVVLATNETAITSGKPAEIIIDPMRAGYWGDIFTDDLEIDYSTTIDTDESALIDTMWNFFGMAIAAIAIVVIVGLLVWMLTKFGKSKK